MSVMHRKSARFTSVMAMVVLIAAGECSGWSAVAAAPRAGTALASALTISSVSPARTSVGRSISINGTGLGSVSGVQVGSARLNFHIVSANRITASIPAAASTGRITVVEGSRRAVSPTSLIVAATVTSISPTSGGLNAVVTVNGTGFTSPATVSFNGVSSPATVVSAVKLTVFVPVGARTGPVTVTSAGSTVGAGTFTVTAGLLLSVTSGPPTSSTVVYGAGFGANELVDLYYGLVDQALVATTASGTFTYTGFTVPSSAPPGTGWISAQGRRSGSGAQVPFLVRASWPQLGYRSSGGRYNPFENTLSPSTVGGLAQAWAFSPGSGVSSSVAVSGGLAYIMSTSNGLSALDATTGVVRWTNAGVSGGYSTPNVTNGVVYVGSSNGTVYALNAATGATLWARYVGNGLSSSPTVSNGIVYAGYTSLTALNATSGAVIWSYPIAAAIYSSPIVSDGLVFFGANDDYVYALNAATGVLVWRYLTGGIVEGVPAVVNGVVYIGSDDASVYAFNARTGGVMWIRPLGAVMYGSPAVANGVVYVGASNSHVYALSAFTGATVWDATTSGLVGASVSTANGVVYASNYASQLYALDASYGGTLWTYTAGAFFFFDGPTVVNGTVYIGNSDGVVRAFTLGAGLLSPATRPALKQLNPNRNLQLR